MTIAIYSVKLPISVNHVLAKNPNGAASVVVDRRCRGARRGRLPRRSSGAGAGRRAIGGCPGGIEHGEQAAFLPCSILKNDYCNLLCQAAHLCQPQAACLPVQPALLWTDAAGVLAAVACLVVLLVLVRAFNTEE
jgi:hypothetical protein